MLHAYRQGRHFSLSLYYYTTPSDIPSSPPPVADPTMPFDRTPKHYAEHRHRNVYDEWRKPRSPTSLWPRARGCRSRQRLRSLVRAWWLCACRRSRSHPRALRERRPIFGFTVHRAIPLPPSPFYRSIPCTLPSGPLLLCYCVLHFLFCFVSFCLFIVWFCLVLLENLFKPRGSCQKARTHTYTHTYMHGHTSFSILGLLAFSLSAPSAKLLYIAHILLYSAL